MALDDLIPSHIGLASPDPAATVRFYEHVVGLAVAEQGPGGVTRLGWGAGHHALEIVAGSGLDHLAFEADDRALEGFEQRLAAHGVEVAWEQPWGEHPRCLGFRDPDGTRIEIHGRVDRSGEGRGGAGRRPDRLHHVSVGSADLDRAVGFYVDVLGFRVSDELGDEEAGTTFAWLRSDRDHHRLAVVRGDGPGLDHFAFEVASWPAIGAWCDELARRDTPVTWGPGRHGPGNNLFAFFDDVDGRHVELSCEMERFWDDRVDYGRRPRRWAPGDGVVNLWGPLPSWREDTA